jgi:ABC-type Fe3+-hydroxamate transport system substrate-binding protein
VLFRSNYKARFIDEFIVNLENIEEVLESILLWGDRLFGKYGELEQYLGKRAENTIKGYEKYIEDFKERLRLTHA